MCIRDRRKACGLSENTIFADPNKPFIAPRCSRFALFMILRRDLPKRCKENMFCVVLSVSMDMPVAERATYLFERQGAIKVGTWLV